MKLLQMEYANLNEKDVQLLQLEEQINAKRALLLEKQKKIKLISKQNHFLEDIRNDYSKYYIYISQQKEQQMNALKLLDVYINDLTTSGSLSKHNIEDAKQEQRKIVGEIKSIKHHLDLMIKDTNELASTLNNKTQIN